MKLYKEGTESLTLSYINFRITFMRSFPIGKYCVNKGLIFKGCISMDICTSACGFARVT